MKQQRKLPGILIYLLILFFSVISFVYALNTATNEQQIIKTGGESDPQDGVTISKVISQTDTENFFDITLTVETNSEIKNITTYPDLAVVIVMDISQTMNTKDVPKSAGSSEKMSRLDAAQIAAETFIDMFADEAAKTPAIREIGFVAFNTDANLIFELQDCENPEQAETLKNTMNTKTNKIALADDYASTHNRFTNIEAGLYRAHKMLSQSSARNRFIIFLSDGLPTTYLNQTNDTDSINENINYDGYDPYMTGKTVAESDIGKFYNEKLSLKCSYGTSYSDRGAIKAREMASKIKASGTKIYSVGTGIDAQNTVEYYYNYDKNQVGKSDAHALVDIESDAKTYEVGETTWTVDNPNNVSRQPYKNWLKNSIASGVYYDTTDAEGLLEAYKEMFKTIQEQLKISTEASWVANDPMGALVGSEKIEFVGFHDDASPSILHESLNDYKEDGTDNTTQSDTASFNSSSSVIDWDLKNSTYDDTDKKITENGEITYYKYILKYRVRLKNEINNFVENYEYKTNGTTSLTYAVLESNGVLSENKTLLFKEPSVKGYLGEFSFIKYSSYGNRVMEGVKFKLVHNPNCTRHQGFQNMTEKTVTIPDMVATSDENGLVTFTNIPSGHDYILKEVEAPADHDKAEDVEIIVAYDKVYKAPGDNGVVNKIKTGSLEIKKQVEGNDKYAGTFEFELEIKFNGNALTDGPYKYVIKDSDGKKIKSGEQNFKGKTTISLKKDQTYTIEGLPVGATYTLKEITTNGYKVQYQINDKDIQTGDTAKCNSSNSCRIEKGSNNTIVFINTAGYILPATGDSGMLILIIIASLLLIAPIIDIGYMFYKNRKEDKLTS